jgi:hypothetical protein
MPRISFDRCRTIFGADAVGFLDDNLERLRGALETGNITWIEGAADEVWTSIVVLLIEGRAEDSVLLGKVEVHCESTRLENASDGKRIRNDSAMPGHRASQ